MFVESRSKTISTSKARQNFSVIINHVAYGSERVVLTRHGKQIAGIVPMSDIIRLRKKDEQEKIRAGVSVQELLVKDLEKDLGLSEE